MSEETAPSVDEKAETFWDQVKPQSDRWPRLTLDPYQNPWWTSKVVTYLGALLGFLYAFSYLVDTHILSQFPDLTKTDRRFASAIALALFFAPIWMLVDVVFNVLVLFVRTWLFALIIGLLAITIPVVILSVTMGWVRM